MKHLDDTHQFFKILTQNENLTQITRQINSKWSIAIALNKSTQIELSLLFVSLDSNLSNNKNWRRKNQEIHRYTLNHGILTQPVWKLGVCAFAIVASIARGEIHVTANRKFRKHGAINIQPERSSCCGSSFIVWLVHTGERDGSRSASTFSSINSNWCRSIYLSTKRFLRADGLAIFP